MSQAEELLNALLSTKDNNDFIILLSISDLISSFNSSYFLLSNKVKSQFSLFKYFINGILLTPAPITAIFIFFSSFLKILKSFIIITSLP